MSLFNTIKTGATGLGASGSSLAVIGDNIANLNTRGFKKGRIAFADVMPQFIGSVNGISQVGRGAVTSGVNTMHLQGGFQSTGSALDLAIGGDGFFQVSDPNGGKYYTRDGSFRVDADNYVTTLGGMKLQGYPAVDGQISGQAGPLQLQTTPLPSKVTETLTLNAVLDPNETKGTAGRLGTLTGTADGSAAAPTINELTEEADWSTSITVYDSLGQSHEVTVLFEYLGTGGTGTGPQWSYSAVVDGSELDDGTGNPQGDGFGAKLVDSGTLQFNTDGTLASVTPGTPDTAAWPGADAWTPTFDFGENPGELGNLISNANAGSSAISFQQDGYGTAFMTGLSVNDDGMIMGQYDNGETKVLGQVALARFPANDGLARAGGNLYSETLASGDPTLGVAGTGGRGTISGYALESSNVDLEDEFVNMIQSQRSYQANESTVRASDESLQTLVQLV